MGEGLFVVEAKGVVESGGEVDYHAEIGGILWGIEEESAELEKGRLEEERRYNKGTSGRWNTRRAESLSASAYLWGYGSEEGISKYHRIYTGASVSAEIHNGSEKL